MAEELEQAQEIYDLIVTYLVTYGFQVLGAIIILLIGIFIAGKVAGMLNKLMVVYKALADNNIEIPFPQRDVHLIQESSA